jgi:hypothetical protein
MKFRKSEKKNLVWVIEQIPPDRFDAWCGWLFRLETTHKGHGFHKNGAQWIAFGTILGIAELVEQAVTQESNAYKASVAPVEVPHEPAP